MERVVYLLGTGHEYQIDSEHYLPSVSPQAIEAFKNRLEYVCEVLNIKAIGEEMSLSDLEDHKKTVSTPKLLSKDLGIHHKYCNPTKEQQQQLNIKHPTIISYHGQQDGLSDIEIYSLQWEEDLKREPFWLQQIEKLGIYPLLFICGSYHVGSFYRFLIVENFDVHVTDHNWKAS